MYGPKSLVSSQWSIVQKYDQEKTDRNEAAEF